MCVGCETPLIEPYEVQDTYVDGIGDLENLGGCFRTVYFKYHQIEPGRWERVVAVKVVRPIRSLMRRDGYFAKMIEEARPPVIHIP